MTEAPKVRINNGWRAEVGFGPYSGPAGVVEREGVTRVAFFADLKQMERVSCGTIDGAAYAVTGRAKSDPAKGGVKGMVVLTVEKALPND